MGYLEAGGILGTVIVILINLCRKIQQVNDTKWALPLIAMLLGAIGGVVGYRFDLIQPPLELVESILAGIGAGATATGLYTVKTLAEK